MQAMTGPAHGNGANTFLPAQVYAATQRRNGKFHGTRYAKALRSVFQNPGDFHE
jgi:hypothetical protein